MTALINEFVKELKDDRLNLRKLDKKPCSRCGKVPRLHKKVLNHKYIIDRSERMDCESPNHKLVTYHVKCWKEEIKETV
jgi:hypothetical protein